MKQNKKRAFTLVELIVVIAVIGILAAVLIPTFSGATESARKAAVQATADSYRKAYLALAAEKGTELVYYKTVDIIGNPGGRQEIYHAPFGPKELTEFAGVEKPAGLLLVTKGSGSSMSLTGFIYLNDSKGYYSYFNAKSGEFETLTLADLPPAETSTDSIYVQIVDHHFESAGVLPKYYYPGVESVDISDIENPY